MTRRSISALFVALIFACALLATQACAFARQRVIVIDAGHQTHANLHKEPIGPGSSTKKYKVAGGARGCVTRVPEYRLNLRVALKLRRALVARGYKVVMIRTTNNVNISNAQRAIRANNVGADLVIRIHANGSSSSRTQGFMTMVPGTNRWTRPIVSRSLAAGRAIHRATLRTTKARDAGLIKSTSMTGFNWSKVPVVLVEMGFMSSPAEDRRLQTSTYQAKLVKGFVNGINAYFAR